MSQACYVIACDMLFVMGKLDFSLILLLLFEYLHLNCDICIVLYVLLNFCFLWRKMVYELFNMNC